MENFAKERRKEQRMNLAFPIRCRNLSVGELKNHILLNISSLGISIISNKFIPPNIKISLELNMPSRVVNPTARVIWLHRIPHSDNYQIGLEYIEFDPYKKLYLKNFLSEINLRKE